MQRLNIQWRFWGGICFKGSDLGSITLKSGVMPASFKATRPNTMNKYGAVLDDFGLEAMLNKLMEVFICPISTVFFPEVGGATLYLHHGFVVEYGNDKDVELGNTGILSCTWSGFASLWSSSSWCSSHDIWAKNQFSCMVQKGFSFFE